MATFRETLSRLFSRNVIIKRMPGNRLKAYDVGKSQGEGGDSMKYDRHGWHRSRNTLAVTGWGNGFSSAEIEATRKHAYDDYESMDTDGIISSALDIYADECHFSETIIPLLNGKCMTIKELCDNNYKNFWVYGLDDDGNFIPVQSEKVIHKGKRKCMKITFDDGTEIICTPNHKWKTPTGMIVTSDLKIGSSIYALATRKSKTKSMNGYEQIKHNGKFEFTHRIVARSTQILGNKKSCNKPVIHHTSFDKLNNSPEVLEWMGRDEHIRLHMSLNEQMWENRKNDPKWMKKFRNVVKDKHIAYWTPELKQMVSDRQSKFMYNYTSNLSQDERDSKYGNIGDKNGMFGNGHKLVGSKNGRYIEDLDRANEFDIDDVVKYLFDNNANGNTVRKILSKKYNLNRQQYLKLTKRICVEFGIPSIKYVKSLFINNHKVTSIEMLDDEVDVYDLVNTGTNHLYAIEANDGAKLYSHNCTTRDANGNLLTIRSQNPEIKKILYNLFYDILNIQTNLWSWVRSACKYGDYILYLVLKEDMGVINVIPIHPSVIEREEGFDPTNPDRYRFRYTGESMNMVGRDYFEEYEVAHIRLLTDSHYLPYGRSILDPGRREYKKLNLLEDAMLLHRIMRAPERRIFKVDIGNIAPEEVDAYMEDFISSMKKIPYIDQATGDYNLKFNLQNMLEDYYMPVRGSDSGTSIEALPGLENEGQIDDVEYVKSKLLASLKIPKAWLGFDENVEGKATLAAEDIRFARTTERVQNFIESELYKIAVTHLFIQGFKSEELLDFELLLANPSTIYKRQQIDLLNEKMNLATNMMESRLFSNRYIYERIFDLSEDEWKAEHEQVIEDLKEAFRKEQISTEGNDPKTTGKSFGTPHDMAALQMASKLDGDEIKNLYTTDDRENNQGAPEKFGTYGTDDDQAFGRDPDGKKTQDQAINPNLRAHRAYDLAKDMAIGKTIKLNEHKENIIKMLDESSLLNNE